LRNRFPSTNILIKFSILDFKEIENLNTSYSVDYWKKEFQELIKYFIIEGSKDLLQIKFGSKITNIDNETLLNNIIKKNSFIIDAY